ncbi:DNA helicase RecQ [Bacillus sp. DJP31]|uniref:DNA helicase RecQ n=1 Tax=Bacillus sp. DJP31 TaxID=3409789 RepID=UPI003BB61217
MKKYYGYDRFRKGQAEAIGNVLQGRNSLVLMPTGGGKSVCYQIPALLMDGVTLVISPLISLMKDQVDSLKVIGIPATFINSSLSNTVVQERLKAAQNGDFKMIYIAPERFESPQFCSLLENLHVSMVAVDEAHCISHWGHDFRPSYRTLSQVIQRLTSKPIILALTATATKEVSTDISKLLSIQSMDVFATGFKRDNLTITVEKGAEKFSVIKDYLEKNNEKSGIIYASTRKDVDKIHDSLKKLGYPVAKYHAGLSDEDRKRSQEEFLYDKSPIMVATNAFGMGINKSNVRFVFHYQLPKNIESYYQEAGRAGRDGEMSECTLLFSPQDVQLQKYLIEQTQLNPDRKQQEYKKLQTMIDFCHTEKCLHAYLLQYFGETDHDTSCENCANCKDDREKVDITKDAQIIFSCIKRMNERFGVTLVSQVLKGSKNKRIVELGFQKLTTYGLLSKYPEKDISSTIQYLTAEGYLALTDGQYPTLSLTKMSVPVLKGENQIYKKVQRIQKKTEIVDQDLFNRLRELRKEISTEENVPPFMIFSDRTLRELCEDQPRNMTELIHVKGIGEQKRDRYGERFLSVILEYIEENGQVKSKMSRVETSPKSEEKTPAFIESYELYKDGQSLKEISKKRDRSLVTIQNHLILAAEAGYEIDWDKEVTQQQEQLIIEKILESGDEKLRPIKDLLPSEIDYFQIKLILTKMKLRETVETS